MVGKHIFLSGKVQGVGFRFHAHEKAMELDLKGWVRNLDDGRVELLAFGTQANLDVFLKWLKKGPSAARVENVEANTEKRAFKGTNFSIRRDGGPTWPES